MTKQRNNKIIKLIHKKNSQKNVISSYRYFVISLLAMIFSIQNSFAATIGDRETILSPPVGKDILPGGNVAAEDIKESIIFSKIIPFIITYAIRLAIALSVIALIIGGYQFITAYGDTEKHNVARKTITYALIGLVISITAYGIVYVITSIQLT